MEKQPQRTMIGDVLTAAGQHGLLSGNIGYPASQVAQTASDKDTLVMELSSFQLMGGSRIPSRDCGYY